MKESYKNAIQGCIEKQRKQLERLNSLGYTFLVVSTADGEELHKEFCYAGSSELQEFICEKLERDIKFYEKLLQEGVEPDANTRRTT